ncbi:MAG: hypothetical protein KJ566_01140 [Nanoarchaeota archaeon]|nr:hypothetical protein [Nanoarchaeota archaeon]
MKTENKLERKFEVGLKDALIPFALFRSKWKNHKLNGEKEIKYFMFNCAFSGVVLAGIIGLSLVFMGNKITSSKKWSELQTQKQVQKEIQTQKNFYELLQKYDLDNGGSLDSTEFLNCYKNRFY